MIDRGYILDRIIEHYKFGSDSEFAKFLGIKPQTLSSWRTRNTFDINLIYAKCINVNPELLLSGEGEVEKPNIKNKLYNESITKSITFSDKTKNAENVTHLIEDPLGIPLIPITAMAGFGEGDFQIMEYETSRYLVPEFTELKVDFMIKVKGSSMRPKYNSGDLVACKKLELTGVFFQWNKVYVLATEQGALIKRVKKGTDDDHILIVSDNPAYDPFELSISKINAIAIVCGVIRLE